MEESLGIAKNPKISCNKIKDAAVVTKLKLVAKKHLDNFIFLILTIFKKQYKIQPIIKTLFKKFKNNLK